MIVIIIILALIYLAIGVYVVNQANGMSNKSKPYLNLYERLLWFIFWIILFPISFVYQIVIQGKKV